MFSGWIHLKVIRCFVESVLRFGLPVDFLPVFVEPNMKREKQLKGVLKKYLTELLAKSLVLSAEEEEENENDDNSDSLPYVFHKFTISGIASGSGGGNN